MSLRNFLELLKHVCTDLKISKESNVLIQVIIIITAIVMIMMMMMMMMMMLMMTMMMMIMMIIKQPARFC